MYAEWDPQEVVDHVDKGGGLMSTLQRYGADAWEGTAVHGAAISVDIAMSEYQDAFADWCAENGVKY